MMEADDPQGQLNRAYNGIVNEYTIMSHYLKRKTVFTLKCLFIPYI